MKRFTNEKQKIKWTECRDFTMKIPDGFSMTWKGERDGCIKVTVLGVKKIINFTEDALVLQLVHERKLSFCGNAIECFSYASGAVEVNGKITQVFFEEG